MMKLLIIADDFTGALDTGVQFAAQGVHTKVVVDREIDFSAVQAEVLVVDTETRHLTARQAYSIVEQIAEGAKAAEVPYIYKKTDSALRGNVGAELTAVLRAAEGSRLSFLPAFPQMNRNTISGVHYIDGVPVTESPFGIDPFEPVKHAQVTELLKEQSDAPCSSFSAIKEGEEVPDAEGILVFDSESMEDLITTGRCLHQKGYLTLMAGCAGFAEVLPELLGLACGKAQTLPEMDSRFLVVCGSVNPITVRQLDCAQAAGFVRVHLTPEQKLTSDYWQKEEGEQTLKQIESMMSENALCILDSNDEGGNELTASYARERGLGIEGIRQGISRSIGFLVEGLFASPHLGTLLITGGDTLLQCMQCIGVNSLEPVCEMEKGIVLSRFTYKGCSRYVITKSGGFGGEKLLLELAERIAASKKA